MNFEQQQMYREREELDASKRPERARKVIDFLEKIKAYDFFHELSTNEEKKGEISFEQFEAFLLRINGIAREIPINKRNFDGGNVEITGGLLNETILPPRQEDKEDILRYAFDAAEGLDNAENSYMLPAIINHLHMFGDANGRTARIIHLLLNSDGEPLSNELSKALSADGRFDSEDINPDYINFELEKRVLEDHNWYSDPDTGQITGHDQLKGGIASALYPNVDPHSAVGKNLEKLSKIAESDPYYILTAVIENLSSEKYESILLRDEAKPMISGKLISPENMMALEKGDWNKIFEGYYKLKKEHALRLVDIFKEPENYLNEKGESLKDVFINRIKEEYKKNNGI